MGRWHGVAGQLEIRCGTVRDVPALLAKLDGAVLRLVAGAGRQALLPTGPTGPLTWVEVLRRYSNRPDLLGPLLEVLRRIGARDTEDEPGVCSTGHGGGSAPVRSRLSDADVHEIVDRFRAGTSKHRLAGEYGMSLSTMKRLLRRYR